MSNNKTKFSLAQMAFQEIFVGTLIYVVVLGLMNDYTEVVSARSFSTILFSSVALEVLTFLTFKLKGKIVSSLKSREGAIFRFLTFFSVWLVMFLSKFVLVWALDFLFGEYISIKGFFGILAVVLAVTVIHKLAYYVFRRLGDG